MIDKCPNCGFTNVISTNEPLSLKYKFIDAYHNFHYVEDLLQKVQKLNYTYITEMFHQTFLKTNSYAATARELNVSTHRVTNLLNKLSKLEKLPKPKRGGDRRSHNFQNNKGVPNG